MTAIVIGSTGLTGSVLIRLLLADPGITTVISISRRSLNIPDPKLVEILVVDLSELPSITAKIRGDLYFCCLGTTIKTAGSKENFEKVDHDAIVAFAEIAKAYKAKSFTLISSLGANVESGFFYNKVKGRTERDVATLGFRSLIIFRPALLVGPRTEYRFLESIAQRTLVPLSKLLPGHTQRRFITRVETLAASMLAAGKAAPDGVHVIEAKDIHPESSLLSGST
ncbi:MAG TPA: NAD(P)H-binding protein [Pyrinomonadaceae bacterium]|nr:NAD(P)H-binding protein [Pyrinomonadaceae bacterium]